MVLDNGLGSENVWPPSFERENIMVLTPGPSSSQTTLMPSLESTAISGSKALPDECEISIKSEKVSPKSFERRKTTRRLKKRVSPQTMLIFSAESRATRGENAPPSLGVMFLGFLNFVPFFERRK